VYGLDLSPNAVRRPEVSVTELSSLARTLGHGMWVAFGIPGCPAVRQTPPAHNGSTPRKAR